MNIYRDNNPLAVNGQGQGGNYNAPVISEKIFPENFPDKLSTKELSILREIALNPKCKIEELALKLGVTHRTITNRIKLLKEKGIMRRVGSVGNMI